MTTFQDLKKYNVFFSHNSQSGNPAAVVQTTEEDSIQLQAYAQTLNLPIVVFLLPALTEKEKNYPRIRFFYPNRETNICVHGGLALACHLLNQRNYTSIIVLNKDNVELTLSKSDNKYFITLNLPQPINKSFNFEEVLQMLNIDQTAIEPSLPFKIASAGSQKLLIPVKNLSILGSVQPKFDQISQWSQRNEVNGFYVYTSETLEQNSDFHARNFNPLSGLSEDIATGIAAAALGTCFIEKNKQKSFCIEQGFFLKKPCLIYIDINDAHFKAGGNVKSIMV